MGSVAAHGRAQHGGTAHAAPQLRVVTWNIAAINNNPFEYWCAPALPRIRRAPGWP